MRKPKTYPLDIWQAFIVSRRCARPAPPTSSPTPTTARCTRPRLNGG